MIEPMKRVMLMVSAVLCFALLASAGGFAFVARTGAYLTVERGEVIDEDVFFAGETVSIRGTVNGDLFIAAKTINIEGNVKGGALLIANRITLSGTLSHSLRMMGQSMVVEGTVGGDILAVGNEVVIGERAQVKGDVVFGARSVLFGGPVGGYVLGGGSSVELQNRIGDDVYLAVKTLSLARGAKIGGDLVYYSEKEASIEPGAEVAGAITHRIPEFRERLKEVFPFVILAGVVGKIVAYLMMLLVGLVVILLMPRWVDSLAITLKERIGACAGWGALILFVVPVGVAIAFSTVVGITLGAITLSLYIVALYLSQIIVGLLLGRLILRQFNGSVTAGALFGAFALGLLLIRLVRFIPGIGFFVWLVVALFGLGAIVVEAASRRKKVQRIA